MSRDVMLSPRQTGTFIASRCKDVHINDEKVTDLGDTLAKEFLQRDFTLSDWKANALHPQEANEQAVDKIFVNDVLNFCFWPDKPGKKYGISYNGKIHTGYWSMVAALRRAEDQGTPVYDSNFMANVTEDTFAAIFASDTEVSIPLLKERWEAYVESGKMLLEKFNGKFDNCIRSCNRDAVALRDLIVKNFKSFRDEAIFENQKVSFYKRAQILVADIWCCFEGKGLGEFTNIEDITMFADYRVPQTLHHFGVLKYSQSLKDLLNERSLLPSGDRIEMEIRGASIEATERLVKETRRLLASRTYCQESQLAKVNAITVDNFLWDYAREHRREIETLPFHLVRTIFY